MGYFGGLRLLCTVCAVLLCAGAASAASDAVSSPQFPSTFYAFVTATKTGHQQPVTYGLYYDYTHNRRRLDVPTVIGGSQADTATSNSSTIATFIAGGGDSVSRSGSAEVMVLHHVQQLALLTTATGQGSLSHLQLPPLDLVGTDTVNGVPCTVWSASFGGDKLTAWESNVTHLIAQASFGSTLVRFDGMTTDVGEWAWRVPPTYRALGAGARNETCFWCSLQAPAQILGQDGGESIMWEEGEGDAKRRRSFWFYGDTVMPVHWPSNTLLEINATTNGTVTGVRYKTNATSGRAIAAVDPLPAPAAALDCYHLWLGAGVALRGSMYVHFQQLYAGDSNHPNCKPLPGAPTGYGMVTAPLGSTSFGVVGSGDATRGLASASFTQFPYLTDACVYSPSDDYVYSYELDNPTHHVYLRRVSADRITDPAAYEVWIGSDSSGTPTFVPVSGANHTGPRVPFLLGFNNQLTVVYNRYLQSSVPPHAAV